MVNRREGLLSRCVCWGGGGGGVKHPKICLILTKNHYKMICDLNANFIVWGGGMCSPLGETFR